MTHPKRADAFKEWSRMMLEQATVPDRLQYKSLQGKTSRVSSSRPSAKRGKRGKRLKRKKRVKTSQD